MKKSIIAALTIAATVAVAQVSITPVTAPVAPKRTLYHIVIQPATANAVWSQFCPAGTLTGTVQSLSVMINPTNGCYTGTIVTQ